MKRPRYATYPATFFSLEHAREWTRERASSYPRARVARIVDSEFPSDPWWVVEAEPAGYLLGLLPSHPDPLPVNGVRLPSVGGERTEFGYLSAFVECRREQL